jgi:hypothetical protein
MSKNSNKVAWTRTTKTTTTIYKMDQINGLRSSSVTEVVEVMEVASEMGLDPADIRDAADLRRFNRESLEMYDSCWEGRR